ncbi:MAG: Crp/Fnr family transcriptional regulator [Paramuribaculum sp.]|nr:Crp/Fnr family transcriptional regulator [Paramuribaculum sp.]
MARLNEFMTRIDLSALADYVVAKGTKVVYAKGNMIVRQGNRCRYLGIVRSGYFKYVSLNSKDHEVVTGFSFEGDVVTDYVCGFLFDQPSPTSIVAGCEAEIVRVDIGEVRRHLDEMHPGFVADASSRLLQEAYGRYLDLLVRTPAERYRDLISLYPDVTKTLPVQELASYLGVSRRQFHRIREAEGGMF